MKVLVVGAGGIGSHFLNFLRQAIKKDYNGLLEVDVKVADYDIIEEKNMPYTIYGLEDIGKKKTDVIKEKLYFDTIDEEITQVGQLRDFDFIILCVDNNEVRKIVLESGKPFLDMRAKGRGVSVFLQADGINEFEKTIERDIKEGCQYQEDLDSKDVQFGNVISASIGLQYFLNYLRYDTKTAKHIQYY